MNRSMAAVAAAAILLGAPGAAAAKDKRPRAPANNALTEALNACRQISDSAARLACFDQASARLAEAIQAQNVVVMDRQEIRQTRRSLFGFNLPRISLFRGEDGEETDEITTKVESASSLGMGKWSIRVEGGALWHTTQSSNMSDPRPGQTVVIKRGALGNYFIRVDGQRGVPGKRVG